MVTRYIWKVTESDGSTFTSEYEVKVGQKTSGFLYATRVEKIPSEQIRQIRKRGIK